MICNRCGKDRPTKEFGSGHPWKRGTICMACRRDVRERRERRLKNHTINFKQQARRLADDVCGRLGPEDY